MEILNELLCNFVRVFIEGGLSYYLFDSRKLKKDTQKNSLKSIIIFGISFSITINIIRYFSQNSIVLRILSSVLFFIFLLIRYKRFYQWRFMASYAVFINCIFEFNAFVAGLGSSIIAFTISKMFGEKESLSYAKIISDICVVLIFWAFNYVDYKLNMINIKAVKVFSNNNILFISFSIYMVFVLLIKYYIRNFMSSDWELTHTFLFWFTSVLFLYAVAFVNKKYEEKIVEKNNLEYAKIEEALDSLNLTIPISCREKVYEKEVKIYSEALLRCYMSSKLKGFNQLVLAIIIVKYFPGGREIELRKDVYDEIARISGDTNGKAVEENIRTVIRKGWSKASIDDLDEMYLPFIDKGKGAPTNKEFIMYMANIFNDKGDKEGTRKMTTKSMA